MFFGNGHSGEVHMKYQHKVAVFLGGIFFAIAVFASPLAVVNGQPIDESKLNDFVQTFVKNGEKDTPELRQRIKEFLIDQELVLQEALRLKIDQQKAFKDRIKTVESNALYASFLEHVLAKKPIQESAIRARYDELKNQMRGTKQYHLRQIVVKTEAEANKIIQTLAQQHNAGFEKLAMEKSVDTQTRKQGGDMGVLSSKTLEKLPYLWSVLSAIKKGQISQKAIQSTDGWRIFKVDDITEMTIPTYESTKEKILRELQQAAFSKAIEVLRQKATIK